MRIVSKFIQAGIAWLAIAAFSPALAPAQVTPPTDTALVCLVGADTTVISLIPPRPVQGSVIRVGVRPGRLCPLGSRRDSTTRDSTVRDSVRRDPVQRDSTMRDSTRRDSTLGDFTRPDTSIVVRATLFNEPLHFERLESGEYVAIGGIPVDAPATVRIPIIIERAGMIPDTTLLTITVVRGGYRMERLAVAPRFGQAPDLALSARLARETALAAEVSRRSHDTPRLWTGTFGKPRTTRVTSAFGDGREFNGTVQSRHMGLDLAGAVGAPVLATNRGVVALVGEFYYAGNAVYIDHGAGLVTAYFHLSKVDVAKGDTVSVGTQIGLVGATGRVTGPHLHWVARYGGITVNPESLLDLHYGEMAAPRVAAPEVPAKATVTPPTAPPPTVPPPASPPPPDAAAARVS